MLEDSRRLLLNLILCNNPELSKPSNLEKLIYLMQYEGIDFIQKGWQIRCSSSYSNNSNRNSQRLINYDFLKDVKRTPWNFERVYIIVLE